MSRILLIGCGNLGGRHLQAIACLPQVEEVEVIDQRMEALQLGKSRLDELPNYQTSIIFRWLNSLEKASKNADLCIIATQARGRTELIKNVFELKGCTKFLVEKIVSQSVQEYQDLMLYSSEHNLSIWVNCKARAHASHKRVQSRLDPKDPISFAVVGGNHGLANNGVHVADLFVFYDDAKKVEWVGGHIDPILHSSKRGKTIFDLSGTMVGHTEKGSHFTLSFASDHVASVQFFVMTKNYRAIIDDMMKWLYESEAESGWEWKKVSFDSDLTVSNMSRTFVKDILVSGDCELPTLKECFPAHQFILENLQPHFNKLLGKQNNSCPVT